MKTLTSVVFMATMLFTTPKAHAMFGHTAEERQRRITTEQQLSKEQQRLDAQQHLTTQQQRLTSRWQTTAFVLGVSTVVTLIIGTAIGSRGRHHAARGK